MKQAYECPKCHRTLKFEGTDRADLIAQLRSHITTCTSTPPRSRKRKDPNGRGLLQRMFKRHTPPPARPVPVTARSFYQIIEELEEWDEAYMQDFHAPPPAPTSKENPPPPALPESPPLPAPESALEAKAQHYTTHGFDFSQQNAVKSFQEFQKVREYFLLQKRVVALLQMYSLFYLSFVDYHGGYGLDDHKKYNWLSGMAEIRQTLEHLKGRAAQGIFDPDVEGVIELEINIQFETMIASHTMDTLSAREADKQERLIKLAEATIAQAQDSQDLRDLFEEHQKTTKKKKEEPP